MGWKSGSPSRTPVLSEGGTGWTPPSLVVSAVEFEAREPISPVLSWEGDGTEPSSEPDQRPLLQSSRHSDPAGLHPLDGHSPVRQPLMEIRAYSLASQSHLIRALSVLETAMDWSRAREHFEARGNHRTDHLVTKVVPLKPSTPTIYIVSPAVITGLEDMCNQALVDLTYVSYSIQEYPLQWSAILFLLES